MNVGDDAHIVPLFISSTEATQRAPAVGDDAHIVPFFISSAEATQCAPCGLISDPQHILRKT